MVSDDDDFNPEPIMFDDDELPPRPTEKSRKKKKSKSKSKHSSDKVQSSLTDNKTIDHSMTENNS